MNKITLPDTGFVRIKDVLKHFPVSESHWWAGVKQGTYPQPIKLSPRVTVWKAEDIHALIDRYSQNFIEKQPAKTLNHGGDNE